MPVEIRKLIIKGIVHGKNSSLFNPKGSERLNNFDRQKFKKELIKDCMDQILQKLEKQNRR